MYDEFLEFSQCSCRDSASSVTFLTASAADGSLKSLACATPSMSTLVIYMGLTKIEEVCHSLMAKGFSPMTPLAIVTHASLGTKKRKLGTLSSFANLRDKILESPGVIIIGEIVNYQSEANTLAEFSMMQTKPSLNVGSLSAH
ncbi:MAG: hypothetical protein AB8G05_08870 [Oligoflexales bacterium]